MDILAKTLQAYLGQLGWRTLADLIAEKAAAQGVQLTPREKRVLARRLAKTDGAGKVILHNRKGTTNRNISITITPDECARLIGSVQQVLDTVPSITKSLVTDAVPLLTSRLRKRWPQQAAAERRQMAAFSRRLQRRWKEPLSLLSMMLTMSRELGDSIHKKLHSPPAANARPITNEVIVRLHARACQVTAEVVALLRAGFADGAMARWRTLYEIAVTAYFILENGEDVAERYLAHRHVEAHRTVTGYERVRDRLGHGDVWSPEEIAEVGSVFDAVLLKYDTPFSGPYGWAAKALGCKSPQFSQIEKASKIDHLHPYYKLASQNVHADPNALYHRLGLIDQNAVLLAGASNFGLGEPAQHVALALAHVSVAVSQLQPTVDSIVITRILLNLSSEVRDVSARVQRDLELYVKAKETPSVSRKRRARRTTSRKP